MHMVSWGGDKVPSLMLGSFTPMHWVTVTPVYHLSTVVTSFTRRRESIVSWSERLNWLLTPLVFSTTGGMGKETDFIMSSGWSTFSPELNLIQQHSYVDSQHKAIFTLRSATMCIWGTMSIPCRNIDSLWKWAILLVLGAFRAPFHLCVTFAFQCWGW